MKPKTKDFTVVIKEVKEIKEKDHKEKENDLKKKTKGNNIINNQHNNKENHSTFKEFVNKKKGLEITLEDYIK